MRHQLGHSRYLTVERDVEGRDVFRSYETPILVLDEKNSVLFADYRQYSPSTTKHQHQLAHFRPNEYVLPEKREKVTYEYCLKQNSDIPDFYSPLYRAKDNSYDPWHECYPGESWRWIEAYSKLCSKQAQLTGVCNEQVVHDNFIGTF